MWAAVFFPALVGALATAVGSLAGRVLIALGIGFVTYKGVDVSILAMKNAAVSSVQGLSADALALVGFLWLDKALSMMFSAVAASMAIRAIGGSVKKMVFK
ncbi:DUF2523 family protein [Pseudomonas sp.]|uniref:DUF2523 family protein n=1 Tax=Pseudomonas sp. TaxID=306 RepID=UPI002635D4C3|nr:DUF2523 family protein [Pseudomonas sp.]